VIFFPKRFAGTRNLRIFVREIRKTMDKTASIDLTGGLHRHLGMELSHEGGSTSLCLTVGPQHLTPFGTLSGGVMLALEETLAGILSVEALDGRRPMGISVSANHLAAAREGDRVRACGRALHLGATTHVWQIELRGKDDRLLSVATVTNLIR
jgi:uncharacterized protein (TIGR00369 family)